MTHGKLWPSHPKPFPDELLSSWIVRLAQANVIKLETLTRELCGTQRTPWNRDIDRTPPPWLVDALCAHTGVSRREVQQMALSSYEGRLFPHRQVAGAQRWILTVRVHGTHREAYGQQFCPECLATDDVPYYRRRWRVALFTYCPEHQVELCDACPSCKVPVVHYRGDFNRELKDALPLYVCHACGLDFRQVEQRLPWFPDAELHRMFDELLGSFDKNEKQAKPFDIGFFAVMHQFTHVMGKEQNDGQLLNYLLEHIGLPAVVHTAYRNTMEERRRSERHQWILCVLWLMADLEPRLRDAWLAKAIRYNLMLRDFDDVPVWYRNTTERFSNWRDP